MLPRGAALRQGCAHTVFTTDHTNLYTEIFVWYIQNRYGFLPGKGALLGMPLTLIFTFTEHVHQA